MCIICVELEKDKLSPLEALINLGEMAEVVGQDHVLEVLDLVKEKEEELKDYLGDVDEEGNYPGPACDCD